MAKKKKNMLYAAKLNEVMKSFVRYTVKHTHVSPAGMFL